MMMMEHTVAKFAINQAFAIDTRPDNPAGLSLPQQRNDFLDTFFFFTLWRN